MVVINIVHNLSFATSGPKGGDDIVCILWKLLTYVRFTIGTGNYYKLNYIN